MEKLEVGQRIEIYKIIDTNYPKGLFVPGTFRPEKEGIYSRQILGKNQILGSDFPNEVWTCRTQDIKHVLTAVIKKVKL